MSSLGIGCVVTGIHDVYSVAPDAAVSLKASIQLSEGD